MSEEIKETDHLLPEDREPDEGELDQFLAEADPQFAKDMALLGKDKNLKVEDILIDDATQELFEETELWRQAKGTSKILFKVFPAMPRLSLRLKKFRHAVAVKAVALAIGAKNRAHDAVVGFFKWSKVRAKDMGKAIQVKAGESKAQLRRTSGKRKALFLVTFIFVGALLAAGYYVLQGKLIPKDKDLFIANFADLGAEITVYDPVDRQELFYDNVRSTPNLFLIPKMVLNIKASPNSGENPMLAVEFFAEGMSPEVILELKDREPYFRDMMQRRMEDYTFDFLESRPGKQDLSATLLKDLNRSLTQGQLRALRIKTIILKP